MLKEVMTCCHLIFMQVSVNFVQTVLVVDTLMYQMKLSFNVEDLLHIYTLVRPKRELGTPFLKGNHYLCLRNPRQPQMRLGAMVSSHSRDFNDRFKCQSKECKDAIQVVNNRQVIRKGANLLAYKSIYHHVILYKVEELNRIKRFLSCPSLAPTASIQNDLAYTPLQLAREVEITHSFREGNDSDASLGETNMGRFRTLGQKKFVLATDPTVIAVPPISQVSLPALDLVLALVTRAWVKLSSLEPHSWTNTRGRSLAGPSKKSKKKAGETTSAYLYYLSANAELWKPEFSTVELGKKPLESYHHLRADKGVIHRDQEAQKEDKLSREAGQARLRDYLIRLEEMLEEEADEVLKEALEVPKELGQEVAKPTKDDKIITVDSITATIAKDRAAAEEAYLNLSVDL
ncbi:hypothetical protein Acr_08g0008370 [Actinidia rufa]|uniref:Uncharacterized protein n=1 Tax=Actinidia rufa TaxID=165716 RepID=A0A7J0F170_9ERIC|nr:hypothetical protein Acr_08g0008370 [Actinidia rufa]